MYDFNKQRAEIERKIGVLRRDIRLHEEQATASEQRVEELSREIGVLTLEKERLNNKIKDEQSKLLPAAWNEWIDVPPNEAVIDELRELHDYAYFWWTGSFEEGQPAPHIRKLDYQHDLLVEAQDNKWQPLPSLHGFWRAVSYPTKLGKSAVTERGHEFYEEIGRRGGQKVRDLLEAGRRPPPTAVRPPGSPFDYKCRVCKMRSGVSFCPQCGSAICGSRDCHNAAPLSTGAPYCIDCERR